MSSNIFSTNSFFPSPECLKAGNDLLLLLIGSANLHQDRNFILRNLQRIVNFNAMEVLKDNNIQNGIEETLNRARNIRKSVLFSYSFRFDVRDVLPLLTHPADKNNVRIFWDQPSRGFAYAGLGSVLNFKDINIQNMAKMKNEILESMRMGISMGDNSFVGPRMIGGFSFNEFEGRDLTWSSFPRSLFLLPECLATLTDDGAWLTISKLIMPSDALEISSKDFMSTISYYKNRLPVTLPPISRVAVDKYRDVPNKDEYDQTIFSILSKIKPGQMEKVVISRSHHVKVGKDFQVVSAMQVLRNAYPKCITFCFSFPGKGIFFGSTPERLVRLKNGFVQTEALAGTIGRGNNMEEDRMLGESLLDSHKEREEHRLVLDQILRKLKPMVNNINHSSIPQIMKLKNVQHLQTPISGDLYQDANILDLIAHLHPTSAVAGTPTREAMEIITTMETHDRGWYSGPIGWLDSKGDGEFYVALRSALVKDGEAHVFAGGGIVSESHPEKEWEETELKLQPIISALSGGQI